MTEKRERGGGGARGRLRVGGLEEDMRESVG